MKQKTIKQKVQIVVWGIICVFCMGLAAFAIPSSDLFDEQASKAIEEPQISAVISLSNENDIIMDALLQPMTSMQSIATTSGEKKPEQKKNNQSAVQSGDKKTATSSAMATASAQPILAATASQEKNIEILHQEDADGLTMTLYRVTGDHVVYEVADIQVASPQQLKTAFAQGKYGKSYRSYPSKIAADNQAVIAINGDYCGFRNDGIIIRNGELYRNNPTTNDLLLVDADGNLSIINEEGVDGEELIEHRIVQTFSFGPAVVVDGEAQPAKKYFLSKNVKEPRTAIGQIEPLHYIFVTVEGRKKDSDGLTLAELGEMMADLGCQTAYNLDGGGTSTMIYRDQVVNRVSGKAERASSDIIYFSGLSEERIENG